MIGKRLFRFIAIGVAVLGIASGWLLYDVWQRAQPVDEEQAASMARQSEQLTLTLQEGLSERVSGTLDNEQQQRMDSQLGLALFRKCVEWSDFSANHPSETARDNEQRACAEYRHYVETGELPE